MPDGKPNISGDLGRRHRHQQPELLQRRLDGLPHAQHRPHRQRGDAIHRLVRRAKLHCRPRGVHQWTKRLSHRHEQGRRARCRHRLGRRGPDDRRAAQATRLRHRPVRQEPLRRQEQAPADRARLRRVLRQPLSPQRRRGTRAVRLSARRPVPQAARLRTAARCAQVQAPPTRRPRSPTIRSSVPSASRTSRTPGRWTPSGWRPSTTTPPTPASTTSSASTRRARRSSCG